MKPIVLSCIQVYQVFLSPFQALFPYCGCRFYPTCSEYLLQAVCTYGVRKGVREGLLRVLKCNPWSS